MIGNLHDRNSQRKKGVGEMRFPSGSKIHGSFIAIAVATLAAGQLAAQTAPLGADASEVNKPANPTPVLNAEAPAEGADEIVVTGSKIRGVAPIGSNLVSVGQETIEKT